MLSGESSNCLAISDIKTTQIAKPIDTTDPITLNTPTVTEHISLSSDNAVIKLKSNYFSTSKSLIKAKLINTTAGPDIPMTKVGIPTGNIKRKYIEAMSKSPHQVFEIIDDKIKLIKDFVSIFISWLQNIFTRLILKIYAHNFRRKVHSYSINFKNLLNQFRL